MKLEHLATATGFLIKWSCALVAVWILGQAYIRGVEISAPEKTKQIELIALSKMFDADKAKQESIKSYVELESKRTTVQMAVRQMVIAEWKKCKKGKC